MIPPFLLGFVGRFAQPLMIAALVALGALLLKAGWDNASLKRQVVKAEARAEDERVRRVKAENDYADLIRDYNEQARAEQDRQRRDHDGKVAALTEQGKAHAQVLADRDRALQLALDSLRSAGNENSRLRLQAAAAAPAECRGYAADPGQLSVPHAEFLVREADRADRAVLRLHRCQSYADTVSPTN